MNILTITANDNGLGGASRIALEAHDAYAAAGHDVTILTGKKVSGREEVTQLGRPLWRKAISYLLANDFDFFDGGQVLNSRQFLEADVVHCHNLNGWYFNLPVLREMSRRKPIVWTLHDMWAITPHSAYTDSRENRDGLLRLSDPTLYPTTLWNNDRWLAKRKTRIYAEMNIHVVTPCQWLKSIVIKTSLAAQPTSVVYNGIDLSVFLAQERRGAKERVGLDTRPTALFVGTTTNPFKGFADFQWLANSGIKSPIQFVCLGASEDATQPSIKLMRATNDRKVISSVMAAADVLVVPSRHEVLPTVIIEAMASGTPVVAYDVGGIPEMLGTVDGSFVVSPRDIQALRRAVIEVVSRPSDEAIKVSLALRRLAEKTYARDRMARQYLELFQSLVAQRQVVRR